MRSNDNAGLAAFQVTSLSAYASKSYYESSNYQRFYKPLHLIK
jgi:hypothetical protein